MLGIVPVKVIVKVNGVNAVTLGIPAALLIDKVAPVGAGLLMVPVAVTVPMFPGSACVASHLRSRSPFGAEAPQSHRFDLRLVAASRVGTRRYLSE